LGSGHPEADAAQVCLYHELSGGNGAAAVLHFGNDPKEEEVLFQSAAMGEARPKLMALIGALAGVSAAAGNGDDAETKPQPVESAAPAPPDAAVSETKTSWPKKPGDAEMEAGKKLERTLREFGAPAQLSGAPLVGPTFVRYRVEPQHGVTVARIVKLSRELQVRLGLDQQPVIRLGEGRIAIDVQRKPREYVTFESLRAELQSTASDQGSSKVLVGVDLRGKVYFVDLAADCPHILVGGSAGCGKSEWLRAAVAGLIETNTPETLRLAVVDPKKLSFTELVNSAFLWRPDALVDSPDSSVLSLLEDLAGEMTRRYLLFKEAAADNLVQYRRKTRQKLPRVVMMVDEFAELLLAGARKQRDEFERLFVRIAAVGRAAGIHLILATQRPSRKVVSGNLKANLPGQIAMRVADRIESGVLINQSGAERLLGNGDLLLAGLFRDPVRLQSAWVSEEERQRIFRGLGLRRAGCAPVLDTHEGSR